ncbi:MAG: hypothetical protein Q9181_005420 [Wetmoreana brouardii]
MASLDFPSPPSKRRKITTTYGSKSVFGRALQAVKDAVPGKLLALSNGLPKEHPEVVATPAEAQSVHESPTSINHSNGAQEPEEHLDHVDEDSADDGRNQWRYRSGSSRPRSSRTSKRLNGGDRESVQTSARRNRRKDTSRIADMDGSKTLAGRADTSTSQPLPKEGVVSDNDIGLNGIENHDQAAAQMEEPPNDKTNGHINGKTGQRSSERPRRISGRFSAQEQNNSTTTSAPQKTATPKTPSSTPGRKRGRPRKHPIATPLPPDQEESRLGFRRITPRENHSLRSRDEAPATRTKRLRRAPEDNDKAANIESKPQETHQDFQAISPIASVNGSIVQGRQIDEELILPNGQPEVYKTSRSMEHTVTELQRILNATSATALKLFKSDLLGRLTGRRPFLVNMDEEYRKVHQLVARSILAGEGNSMLVIGPRGSGKTTLVESVLSDLDCDHGNSFVVVRLNGLIHTDDKIALREVWRQLGREVAGEDTTGIRTNYADALTSLLALLAHSSGEEGGQEEIARSVIFVIDEFDLFASHSRQTLLYNLFDVAQSRNAPIAVIGLTTRIDIVESLEKRVKSRFGQRYVYLFHPRTFDAFQNICRSLLISQEAAARPLHDRLGNEAAQVRKLRATWNGYVNALFEDDMQFQSYVGHLYGRSKCVSSFQSASLLPIISLSPSYIPQVSSFAGQLLLPPDSKLQLLPSLSDLELALLIAAARLDVILDTDVCNFSMVYDEYVQLASRVKVQSTAAGQTAVGSGARVWGQEVAMGAWEILMELGLIIPASTATRGNGDGGAMWRVDVALEEIGPSIPQIGSTMAKWCREI